MEVSVELACRTITSIQVVLRAYPVFLHFCRLSEGAAAICKTLIGFASANFNRRLVQK